MAFINSHKSPTIKTELDIFAVPPTQSSVESGSIQCYRPVSALTDSAPIDFIVPGSSEEYIDLSHVTLHLFVKINGTPNQNVAPANNFLHSMFSQVDVFLNQRNVSPPSSHYHYRSYIEKLLNYGSEAKLTHLQTEMFYKDTGGQMDTIGAPAAANIDVAGAAAAIITAETAATAANTALVAAPADAALIAAAAAANAAVTAAITHHQRQLQLQRQQQEQATNSGHERRKLLSANGRIFELYGHLHCDIFNQNKYLINGVELGVRLVKEKAAFCLIGAEAATFEITEANLFVRKMKINPSILVAHARTLSLCPARYPITRVEIKTVTIPAGIQSKTVDNLYIGQLPKRYFILE